MRGKLYTFLRLSAMSAFLTFCLTQANATYFQIPIASGFNVDIVANGTGPANTKTTAPVDNDANEYAFMTLGYNTGTAISTVGLSVSGLVNNVASPGLDFQLADYDLNNALQLTTLNATGTLSFATPTGAGEVYILGVAGNGPATVDITVNFVSGPPEVFTNQTVNDWYNVTPYVMFGLGRVARVTNNIDNNTTNPRLYQMKLVLSQANWNNPITGITVTKTVAAGRVNIMAVTINDVCTGAPVGGNAKMTPGAICANTGFTLSTVGSSTNVGLSYQWQDAPASSGLWSNMPGATNPSYTVTGGVSVNTDYRLLITCSQGAATTPSGTITAMPVTSFSGGTYTINSSVATGGNNFQNFTDAVSVIKCGITGPVVFNVSPGTYNEQISITPVPGASATNTVTFNGQGATLTYSASLSTAPSTLELNGADYIKVNDLTIIGTGGTYALSCHLWNGADNNAFANCTFTVPPNAISLTQMPFSISGTAISGTALGPSGVNNVMTGCTMSNGYYGVSLVGSSAAPGTGNQIVGCNVLDFYVYGCYTTYQNGTVIRGNNIERPSRTSLTSFYGVYVTTACVNMLVEKNRIHNPSATAPTTTNLAYAIYCAVDGTLNNENKFYNNLIYDMNGSGAVAGLYLINADYYKAYHNTISLDYAGATAGATYGIYSTGAVGGMDIKNNIITITRGGSGAKYCLYFTGGQQSSNYNDLYINAPAGTNFTGYYASVTYPTLLNWQGANSNAWDALSMNQDPVYTSPLAADFTPLNTSLDNAGINMGITTDILGNARSAISPDLGSYEFGSFPLAVHIGNITAGNSGARNRVDWTTHEEINGDKFEVERSIDGENFSYLASVHARGEASAYTYWDETPVSGMNHYRLKVIDGSGSFSYSRIVSANVKAGVFVVEAYPNPVSDLLTVQVYGTAGSEPWVTITDATGKVVKLVAIKGNKAIISTTGMAAGMYLVKYADSLNSQVIKINKQ